MKYAVTGRNESQRKLAMKSGGDDEARGGKKRSIAPHRVDDRLPATEVHGYPDVFLQ